MALFDPQGLMQGGNSIIDEFLGQDPQAAFNAIFGQQASNLNPYSNWLRNQLTRYMGSYKGMLPDEPNLRFTSFLQKQNPMGEFGGLAPQERGERPGQFSPRVKWLR